MHFPGIVYIELVIAPTTFSNFRRGNFSVVKKNRVSEQQVSNTVTGLFAASLDRSLLTTATGANAWLVFEVMTEQGAEFQIVRSGNQGEIIFPDVKVFAILPWGLVPDVRVAACTPEKRWDGAADASVRIRKNCWYLGRDFLFKSLALGRGIDDDVVAGNGELEFVNRSRRQ